MQAEIALEYNDVGVAEAIARAISPDNFKTPKNLKVETVCRDSKVVSVIKCEGKLATFIATIDDLLSCASMAEKTVQLTMKLQK